jgi:anionic cell wall polymer biosynthesis LytR-Cps2A-Psr (LCP) family protein
MVRLKTIMRWIGLMLLVILASAGIGIVGAVPVQPTSKKEDKSELKIELSESKNDNTEFNKFNHN